MKFSRLARRGELVTESQTFHQVYCPSHPRQRKMSLNIYASRDYNPQYIDCDNVHMMKEWVIDLPARYLGRDRPVDLSLAFGNYKTTAKAQSKVTGDILKVIGNSDWADEMLANASRRSSR
jgi:hypothetical protein